MSFIVSLPCHSSRGMWVGEESMGGGTKQQKPLSMTALEAIDPKPSRRPPRG